MLTPTMFMRPTHDLSPFLRMQLIVTPIVLVLAIALIPRIGAGDRPKNDSKISVARDKGTWTIGFAPAYATVAIGGDSKPTGYGASVLLHRAVDYGLALRLAGFLTSHRVRSEEGTSSGAYHVASVTAGVAYAIEVLKVIPAIEAGVGLLYRSFDGKSDFDLGFQWGLGIDYWWLQWLSVGAAIHYHGFLVDPLASPFYFAAGPRVSLRWQ